MKRLILFIGSILLFASAQGQQILNLLTGEVRDGYLYAVAKPVQTIDTLENGYLVTWEFSEAFLQNDDLYTDCIFWKAADLLFPETNEVGYPTLPYKLDWLEVKEYNPKIEIVESNYVDYNYQLAPGRAPLIDDNQYTFETVPPITPFEGFMPDSIVKSLRISTKQGRRRIGYTVSPIQYSYEERTVRAYTKIAYKVTLSDSTTGIEELKASAEGWGHSFSLDGLPAKGISSPWRIREGKKTLLR